MGLTVFFNINFYKDGTPPAPPSVLYIVCIIYDAHTEAGVIRVSLIKSFIYTIAYCLAILSCTLSLSSSLQYVFLLVFCYSPSLIHYFLCH